MSKLKYLLIALVLGISAFTHLYRIDKTFIFNNDEGRDALISYRMVETKRPVLLGPETSVGNMYLGPFYYYLTAPALALSGLNPVGPAIMVGLFGIATTMLLIYYGATRYSFVSGVVAGAFYALSPIMVFSSRSSWNPNVIPFFTLLLLLLYPAKKLWYSLLFGLITGIIFQLHYVALVIPSLLILADLYKGIKTRQWSKLFKHLSLVILGFLISSSPFWLFELRHNFVNIQAFFTYLLAKGVGDNLGYPPYPLRLLANLKLLIGGIIASSSVISSPTSTLTWISGAVVILVYIWHFRGVLTYLTLASLLVVSVLKENIYVHYLGFLYPLISLMIGTVTAKKGFLKIFGFILILSLIIPSYNSLRYNLHELDSTQPKRARETADYIVKQADGRPYNVVNATTSSTATILYYLAISENPPKNDDQNLLFVICQNALCPADIETRSDLLLNGPSHPTLISYLGYTPRLTTDRKRQIIKNEWVTYDIHVASLEIKP
jgi:4-amino-4-deoxy-L-arabinose transferase-like glycosyltransferase